MCSKGSTDSAATLLRARVPQGSPLGGVFVVAIRILGGAFLSVIRVLLLHYLGSIFGLRCWLRRDCLRCRGSAVEEPRQSAVECYKTCICIRTQGFAEQYIPA